MHDLLTEDEDAIAASQGWGVYYVYDLDTSRLNVRVLPPEKITHVVNTARGGSPLHQKALQLLTKHMRK